MMASVMGYAVLLLQQPAEHPQMTAGGWVFLICAWIFILTLVFFTFSKILRGK